MQVFIRVSKFNGQSPATPIYVNAGAITAIEKTQGGGAPTTTLWGVMVDGGMPLQVAEPVDHVVQMIAEAK